MQIFHVLASVLGLLFKIQPVIAGFEGPYGIIITAAIGLAEQLVVEVGKGATKKQIALAIVSDVINILAAAKGKQPPAGLTDAASGHIDSIVSAFNASGVFTHAK